MDQERRNVDYDKLKDALFSALEPLKNLRIDPSRVETGRQIGSGGFSEVFLATVKARVSWYKSVKTPVVVKNLKARGDANQKLRVVVALARELVVWSRFEHPNVLPLLGFYFDDINFTYACAVTELQENGNVLEFVQRTNPTQDQRLELVHDITSGLAYLHSLKPPVCHGDIKPENALVNKVERAMICDFGLAKTLKDDPSGLTTTSQPFTPRYASPEVLQDASTRTLPSDVWSWGCLVYQLVSNQSPYSGMPLGAIYAAATSGQPPAIIDDLSIPSDLKTLLTACWAFAAETRPSMKKCKRTVLKLRLGYSTLSAYFSGIAPDPDVEEELPYDLIDGQAVHYNPDLDRTIEIKSVNTVQIPGSYHPNVFSDNGENMVVMGDHKITSYNVPAMTVKRRWAMPKEILPSTTFLDRGRTIRATPSPGSLCCSRGADLVAFTWEETIYISDFSKIHVMTMTSKVSRISFAGEGRLMAVAFDSGLGVLEGFRIGDKISDVTKVWTLQARAIAAVSPRHPVALVQSNQRCLLFDLRTGDILQELPWAQGFTFAPDGLGILLLGFDREPSLWKFSSLEEVDPTRPSFSLSPTGMRGRFVQAGPIQWWDQVDVNTMSVSSDNSLACGGYREGSESMIQIWSLVARKTLLVFSLPFKDSGIPWKAYFRSGSTAAGGHIDVFETGSHETKNGCTIEYVASGIDIADADLSILDSVPIQDV